MSVQEFVATFEDVILDRIANRSPVFGQPSNSVWRLAEADGFSDGHQCGHAFSRHGDTHLYNLTIGQAIFVPGFEVLRNLLECVPTQKLVHLVEIVKLGSTK